MIYSRFLVVDDEADQAFVSRRPVVLPRQPNSMAGCDVGLELQDVTFTCLNRRILNEASACWAKDDVEKHSQLALSPLLRKSPSSGFSVLPVFSHILWISDMHSLGFRRKKSRPCRIVRLCWFQSHRFCRFWLLMAEKAYMLKIIIIKKDDKKLQISPQIHEN